MAMFEGKSVNAYQDLEVLVTGEAGNEIEGEKVNKIMQIDKHFGLYSGWKCPMNLVLRYVILNSKKLPMNQWVWGNSSRLKMWLFEGHVKISGEDEQKLERSPSESETYLIFAKLKKFKN